MRSIRQCAYQHDASISLSCWIWLCHLGSDDDASGKPTHIIIFSLNTAATIWQSSSCTLLFSGTVNDKILFAKCHLKLFLCHVPYGANRQNNSHSLHCYTFALFLYLCSFCAHFFLCFVRNYFFFFSRWTKTRYSIHSSVVCASTGASLHCPRCRRCTTTIICIHFFAHPPSTKMFFSLRATAAAVISLLFVLHVTVNSVTTNIHKDDTDRTGDHHQSPPTSTKNEKKVANKQTTAAIATAAARWNLQKEIFQRKWKPQRREEWIDSEFHGTWLPFSHQKVAVSSTCKISLRHKLNIIRSNSSLISHFKLIVFPRRVNRFKRMFILSHKLTLGGETNRVPWQIWSKSYCRTFKDTHVEECESE